MYFGLILALLAGLSDHTRGIIPNRLTLPGLLLGLLASFYPGGTTPGQAALGVLLSTLPSLVLFVTTRGTAIGGGDVKLVAALGAWMGPNLGLESQLWGLSFCAVWSFVDNVRRRKQGVPRRDHERLGPFIFLGTITASVLARC